ncbi:MAG TPA: aspartate 1-decarboxylase [Archangium sp.]
MKAQRLVLLAQLHPAVVTTADFEDADGVRLDAALLDAAGLLEHEKLELYDGSTGTRLSCAVRKGKPGELAVCGATAQLIKPGARVTLAAWGWMKEKQALKHTPRTLRLDDDNTPLKKAKAD